jgi:hypothetical protein
MNMFSIREKNSKEYHRAQYEGGTLFIEYDNKWLKCRKEYIVKLNIYAFRPKKLDKKELLFVSECYWKNDEIDTNTKEYRIFKDDEYREAIISSNTIEDELKKINTRYPDYKWEIEYEGKYYE